MDGKRILALIQDVNLWRGDVYRLATLIAEEQREIDAVKAEALEAPTVAEAIRADG
jgi:hypothetical protein